MAADSYYFAYENDTSTIDGPFETIEAAIEAAKDRYVDDADEDETEMLILKVTAKLTMTQSVQVKVKEVE